MFGSDSRFARGGLQVRAAIALAVLAGCGGGQKAQIAREGAEFACRDRSASYMATKHLSGDEIGVLLDCAQVGPRIKRWKTDKAGTRTEDAHGISPEQFERVWKEIEGTGWQNLKDCTNGTLETRDPVYVFDIKDDQNTVSFQCQTREIPYPYHDITQPLDEAAFAGQQQLGDDEPAAAKKLDNPPPGIPKRQKEKQK
ncbi:MAG: hypothetical protein JWO36_5147 [Myxococcales bacterium]|nr:hypothetical protein [Myxococcales bacterium]